MLACEVWDVAVNQLDDEELSTGYFQQAGAIYLKGYLKGIFYQNKPRTIDTLKANITEEIQTVTADVRARIFQNMARRVQSCLDTNGGHFQHML